MPTHEWLPSLGSQEEYDQPSVTQTVSLELRPHERRPNPVTYRIADLLVLVYIFHPLAEPPAKLRDVRAQYVDPAVNTRKDDLGLLERIDATALAEKPRIFLEKGEVCAHFTARKGVGCDNGVGSGNAIPQWGDEVQRAGDVGDGYRPALLMISCCRSPNPCQARKGSLSPLLRLALHPFYLSRDATCKRYGAGQSEDDKGGEFPANEQDEGEERETRDVVGPAALEELSRAGGASVLGDAFHGRSGYGCEGGGEAPSRVGRDAAGGIEGPDEAGVVVDVFEARFVKGEVGFACLEEVRDGARLRGAFGELERRGTGRCWGVRDGR